jgi:hypothetical protein
MQLKSYFSGTAEAAKELARKELGGKALLVRLGAYGVVNSPLTPEVGKSSKPSEEPNGRARELASTPLSTNSPHNAARRGGELGILVSAWSGAEHGARKPLLKSSLFEQRAAA